MAEQHFSQGTLNFWAATESFRRDGCRALSDAQRLESMGDRCTQAVYEDAERFADLSGDQELQGQVSERFGLFLMRQRKFGSARERLMKAGDIARLLGQDETGARIQMSIVEAEIELIGDPVQKAYLHNFREAAKLGSYSSQDKHQAWLGFAADLKRTGCRVAARGIGTVDDFRERLETARRQKGED